MDFDLAALERQALRQAQGRLFLFLEFNRRRIPELTVQDYLDLEAMRRPESVEGTYHVNAQEVVGRLMVGAKAECRQRLETLVSGKPSAAGGQ